ncbi:hypothetical protein QE364_002280 [Nocardioides zeae]|uniref:Uncharacterized protein n=2 Tax=Nocardioides zeae TaxID=1457234 RepID=A0ACC6IIR5_9ACTN|nr:hypothetical protein [Nocardioides zeae]MDQ1105861.1 hypothetical protein [Nocardioides zeae]MDR6174493.1 hypothetical protein [Nocardioides zeae]MDR6210565.1 hypothetical protein [Nocardioides zeae]
MKSLHVRRLALLPVTAVLGAALLAGCSDDDGGSDDAGSSDSSDSSDSGEPGTGTDADTDPSDVPTGDLDDLEELGFDDELPDGFPDDVPLVEGEVQVGAEQTGVYTAALQSDGAPQEAYDEAAGLLEADGYEETTSQDLGEVLIGSFTGDDWEVAVSVIEDPVGGGSVVSYSVTEAS